MKRQIDVDAYLTPISEDRPSGEDLRYTAVYEQIKEARRFDDPLDQGEWKTELKTADWDKVISLAGGALKGQTKDLQIAAWLLEALVITEGFRGLTTGLNLMTGLLDRFWETLYPLIEEGDLEYRVAPLEFLNEKISTTIRQAPVTDSAKTPGYSWLKWQESREVGYEADTRDKYGDTDEGKKRRREDLIQERRLTAEEFDGAVNASPPAFYTALSGTLTDCLAAFTKTGQHRRREIRQGCSAARRVRKIDRRLPPGRPKDLQREGISRFSRRGTRMKPLPAWKPRLRLMTMKLQAAMISCPGRFFPAPRKSRFPLRHLSRAVKPLRPPRCLQPPPRPLQPNRVLFPIWTPGSSFCGNRR